MHCASRCGEVAQTLDMHFPEHCPNIFTPVLCASAAACKRLQHLAMTGDSWANGADVGALVENILVNLYKRV